MNQNAIAWGLATSIMEDEYFLRHSQLIQDGHCYLVGIQINERGYKIEVDGALFTIYSPLHGLEVSVHYDSPESIPSITRRLKEALLREYEGNLHRAKISYERYTGDRVVKEVIKALEDRIAILNADLADRDQLPSA